MDGSEEVTEARCPHRAAEGGPRPGKATDTPSGPQPHMAPAWDQGPTGVYTPLMLSSQALTTTCWADHRACQPGGKAQYLPASQGQSAQRSDLWPGPYSPSDP